MTSNRTPLHSGLPSWLATLETAEPAVAIRLAVVQAGVALALTWSASAPGTLPEVLNFLPFSLGGVLQRQSVFDFGYPLRELVWAGDWWRVATGAFLPPGLGLFLLGLMAFLPFAKVLERHIGKPQAFLVYTLGGLSVVAVDLCAHPGETSGGLGMAFAAAGAVLTLERFQTTAEGVRLQLVPWQTLFFLVLLMMVCIVPRGSDPILPVELSQRSLSILAPSWIGLVAALLTGMAAVLPFAPKRFEMKDSLEDLGRERPRPPGLVGYSLVSGLWFAGLALVCLVTWLETTRLDFRLWKLEPGLQQGAKQARDSLAALIAEHPENPFLVKRAAVSHLLKAEWEAAEIHLLTLKKPIETWNIDLERSELKLRLRQVNLNIRAADRIQSPRFSGAARNYSTSPHEVLVDLAHSARMRGDTQLLAERREAAVLTLEKMLQIGLVSGSSEEIQVGGEVYEKELLNGRAYLFAELQGDLDVAIQEASRSVSIRADALNLDTLGWVEVLRGDLEGGIHHLKEALLREGETVSGSTYYHLGLAYILQENRENARFYFEEALARDLAWWEEIDLFERCPECGEEKEIPKKKS